MENYIEPHDKDTANRTPIEGRSRQTERADRGEADVKTESKVGLAGGGGLDTEEDRKRKAAPIRERKSVPLLLTEEEIGAFEEMGGEEEILRQITEWLDNAKRYREFVRVSQIEYVYTHSTPDGIVFYVGKGRGDRAKNFYNRNPSHRLMTRKIGARNVLIERIECEPGTAKDKEIQLIAFHLAAGSPLVNILHVP